MRNYYDMTLADWQQWVKEQNLPSYRAKQIAAWLPRGINNWAEMKDLPSDLRHRLAGFLPSMCCGWNTNRFHRLIGTASHIFRLPDGNIIESVL